MKMSLRESWYIGTWLRSETPAASLEGFGRCLGLGDRCRENSNVDDRLFDHRQRYRRHELLGSIVNRHQCNHWYYRPASHAGRPLERRLFLCPAASAICVLWRGIAST